MIQLSSVSKEFTNRKGTVQALRGIDLTAAEGEFVAVVGRSGCGKSTLLRLIAGLLPPSSGDIRIGGLPVTGPRREVAMLFQRPALLPWRSVLDNVLLPVEISGLPRAEHRDRAVGLLAMMGLDAFQRRLPHELSGGMQQRVALCRSLIQRPEVLLMDEPFSALDALTREELSVELQRIHLEYAATVVLVTHSVDEAVLLADRVVVLSPRPGHVRTVLDIGIPRPRSLGHDIHRAELARLSAELHELLLSGGG
jgi:NitT/TauT family transport system ATP-binding protein